MESKRVAIYCRVSTTAEVQDGSFETQRDAYIRMVKDIASTCKNKIVFTGYVDNSEVARIEGASDIAVLPSLWDDPLPLSTPSRIPQTLPFTFPGRTSILPRPWR